MALFVVPNRPSRAYLRHCVVASTVPRDAHGGGPGPAAGVEECTTSRARISIQNYQFFLDFLYKKNTISKKKIKEQRISEFLYIL